VKVVDEEEEEGGEVGKRLDFEREPAPPIAVELPTRSVEAE